MWKAEGCIVAQCTSRLPEHIPPFQRQRAREPSVTGKTAANRDTKASPKRVLARFELPASEARLLVLDILSHHTERHLSFQQLCAAMVGADCDIGISTFQTAIYDLATAGVLSRVIVPLAKNRRLMLYEITDQPPHRHFYCISCRRMLEVHDKVCEQRILQQLTQAGLKPTNFDFARCGTCQSCAYPHQRPG